MVQLERTDIDSTIDNKLLIQLTNDDSKAIEPDEERISKIISIANDTIDDALRGQYPLPLQQKSSVLTDIGNEIAIYNIYKIRNRNKLPDDIKTNYQNALSMLDDYSKGRKTLDIITSVIKPVSIRVNSRSQKFTQEILSKY